MKYISRITALLLALMMLTPTFASALTLDTATQSDLDKLYEAANSVPEYWTAGLLGDWTGISTFGNLANKDLYTFQWYDEAGNPLDSFEEPTVLRVANTMEEQKFYCVATDATGNQLTSPMIVLSAADISNAEDYLALLYEERFLDVFGSVNTLTVYRLMTETWNVTMADGSNLAEKVLALWWAEREESYFDPYLLCSCVITGAVESEECVLHPNSAHHAENCSWKQEEITANVDVSKPDSLLDVTSVTLAAVAHENVQYYGWENYVFDASNVGMRWEVVDYILDTNLYEIPVNKDSIQTAYRVVTSTTEGDVFDSKPFYLGGYDFYNWIHTNEDIQAWMADTSVTLADVVARYNEKDCVNADDYTYEGENGQSVNLKVPEGAFTEEYVMEVEPVAADEAAQLQNAVLQSMDATGIHTAQMLMALDISFANLNNRAEKLQPAEGTSVALTFEVDTTGINEALKYLYVYHIADDNTPELVAGPIDAAFGKQTIVVQAEGFSTYLAMATNDYCPYCVLHDYCVYYDLYVYDAETQYEMLDTAGDSDGYFNDTTYDNIIADYKNHIAAGETPILCTCVLMTDGTLVEPGEEHAEDCLWVGTILRVVGLYGEQVNLTVDEEIVNAGSYTYQWYHGDEAIDNATEWQYMVKCTMQTEHYYWVATPVGGGEPIKSGPILVTAQWTSLGEYIMYAVDYYGETNEELYNYLTETLDVDFTAVVDNVEVDKNLADEVMAFWYDKCLADPEYYYADIFCTCVVSGVISSDECMLHPDALHDETCPWYTEVEVIIPPKPDQPQLYYGNPDGAQYTSTETYSLPMADDRAVILPKGGRAIIKSNQVNGAQWQVSDGTQWIDIQGETAADIVVTDAKLNAIFELTGIAQLRYFDKTNNTVLASVSVTSKEIANGEYPEEEEIATFSLMPRAEGDEQADTYSIVINYVFENGEIAADPYTATLAAGSGLTRTVPHPTVLGYLPYIGEAGETSDGIELNIQNIQADVTYRVVYKPTNVNYSVVYYLQNVDNDDYTEAGTETKQGLTGSQVPVMDKTYAGFYQLAYARPEIAADGSTVVEVYYDRNYYLMLFELNGGYGVEPIYARYGANVGTIDDPTRLGYTFNSWSPAIPATVPLNGGTYTAQWTPLNTTYTVIYWQENANDSNYSFFESETVTALSGSKVSGSNTKTYEGFHYDHADSNVTVEGDGSTIVNVYYKRNTYTLTFAYEGGELICKGTGHTHSTSCLTCTLTEHEHSHDECCTRTGLHFTHNQDKCPYGGEEHEHSDANGCYGCGYVEHTRHSVANGCYGIKFEGIKYGQATDAYWAQAPAMKWLVTYGGTTFYTNAPAMPNGNLTIYGTSQSGSSIIYYYEKVNGQETTTSVHPSYTVNTDGWTFTSEDYIVIPGFTYSSSRKNNAGTQYYIYYTRNTYTITFNNGSEVKETNPYLYEADISGAYYVPTYTGDNPDAYEFGGWYTTEDCLDGTEFNFTGAKMPYNNLLLYAKWVPITRTVDFYLTPEDMNIDKKYRDTVTVPNGSKLDDEVLESIADPDRGSYEFVGWFYLEDGVEKAFDFKNMKVTQNLRVFGKWSSKVLKEYTVHFKVQGTDTKVADTITGTTLAGMSKTFDAKGGNELYTSYRDGYFPLTKSHTITLDIEDESLNTFTFWYVQKGAVPYTVYYVAETLKAGEDPADYVAAGKTIVRDGKTYYIIADTYTNSTNRKAVVTEKFKTVSGYMPDAYQKRLVVDGTDGAVNEIIFFYEVDTLHAYYKITHYTQNTDGQTWTEHSSTELIGDINATYSATPITIEGFTFDDDNALNVLSGTLTADGLELKLYYTRNIYPYEVRYLEQGSGKELHAPKSGTGLYNAVVTEEAISITGYDLVTSTPQNITIKIDVDATLEDGTELKAPWRNIITFYYEEREATINYVVVGPDGCGTVSPMSETVKVLTGTAQGSTATASSNTYKFVGWYDNVACEGEALSTDAKYVPKKVNGLNVAATYYAKFVYDVGHLTITKKVVNDTGFTPIKTQFTFTVKLNDDKVNGTYGGITFTNGVGTVTLANGETATISNLLNGTQYTITETPETGFTTTNANGTGNKVTGTIVPGATVNETFTNTYYVGTLTVTKTVQGADAPKVNDVFSDEFNFTLAVPGFTDLKVTFNGTGRTLDGNGETTFTMKHGETVTINGIPDGANYTVTEATNSDYTTTVNGKADDTVSDTMKAGNVATASFVNTYKYSHLTISKTGMEAGESAVFQVKAKSKYNNDQEVTFTVTVPNGKSVTIGELLIGESYTITEIGSWSNRYAAAQPVTGKIVEGGKTVTITNTDKNQQWLHGEDYVHNDFSKPGSYAN